MAIDRLSLLTNQLKKFKPSASRTSMQIKTSKIFNIALTVAILALALNAYQMKQQLDEQLQGSSKSIDKINASIAAIKAHEVELEAKDVAMSALVADLIIKTQEQGQSIDELLAKQTKKK
jgi:uncharacterized membrane protein YidH (DUF202 family)